MKLLYKSQHELQVIGEPTAKDFEAAFATLNNTHPQLIRLAHGQVSINFIGVDSENILIRWRIYGKFVFDMIETAYLQDETEIAAHGLPYEVRELISKEQALEIAAYYVVHANLPPSICFLDYRDSTDARIIHKPLLADIQQMLAALNTEQLGFNIQYQHGVITIGYVNGTRVTFGFRTLLSRIYKIHVIATLLDPNYLEGDVEIALPYGQKGDSVMLSETVDYQKACEVATHFVLYGLFPQGLVWTSWTSNEMEQFTKID